MAEAARSHGLQTIFSFFLGLMLTAFIGVGVYTFHPPVKELDRQIQELDRREQAIRNANPKDELTAADRDEVQQITDSRNQLYDAAQARREAWGRSTSIILIALATLVMAVSLVRADQLPVISNGLLLGGVFTMVYGVGWIVATDTSVSRFVVMTVALAITLGLGYARFVRRRASPSLPAGSVLPDGEGLARLEQRLRDVEDRLNKAAGVLGSGGDR
ncbi:MAG: hypothetical protein IPI48_02845 [bacterium]|jgi:hypothetical protein|nr:hypothetical protein [bacterium]MBK7769487.1 hypothetical protein [bacterium]MBK9777983.1 hypothetical protein [bacterium]